MTLVALLRRRLRLRIFAALAVSVLTVAGMVAGVYLTLDTMKSDAALLNESGRLRMVSQKIAKSAALAHSGDESARAELSESIALFDETYASVQAHLPEVAVEQYRAVDALWQPYREAAETVARPGVDLEQSSAALALIRADNLPLLKEANAGVQVIEQFADSHVQRIGHIVVIGFALVLLSSLLVALILRVTVRHVVGLEKVTRRLAKGDYQTVEVRSEDEIGSLARAIQFLSTQVQRRDHAIETITRTVSDINLEREVAQASRLIAESARELTGASHAALALFGETSAVHLEAVGEGQTVGAPGSVERGHPFFAWVASQKDSGETKHALLPNAPGLPTAHALIATDLVVDGQTIGVIYAAQVEPGDSFSEDDRHFLEQLARLGANAIATKRMSATRRAERMRMRSVSEELGAIMKRVGNGDLTCEPSPTLEQDAIGEVKEGVRGMLRSLRSTISEVIDASQQLAAASTQIACSTDQLEQVSTRQASGVGVVQASLSELVDTINANAQTANDSARASESSGKAAREGGEVVERTLAQIREIAAVVTESAQSVRSLGSASTQIGELVEAIGDIANQTNLLALNAAIEAARAGSAGRGFAVVADEVRKLAERTTDATKQVERVIGAIQTDTAKAVDAMERGAVSVSEGIALADRTSAALESIVHSAERTSGLVSQIAVATEEQSATAKSIAASVSEMREHASQGLHESEQTAAGVLQLSSLAQSLSDLVAQFELTREYPSPASRLHPNPNTRALATV